MSAKLSFILRIQKYSQSWVIKVFHNAKHILFSSAYESEIPGLEEEDKRIRIWLAAEIPSLGESIEANRNILQYMHQNHGPSPMVVLNACYKQLGLILLREKYKVSKFIVLPSIIIYI